MAEVLPDLEQALLNGSPTSDFWKGVNVRVLAESQGVQPVDDLGVFQISWGGWPEDESVDDFILAVRAERRQNPAEVGA